MAMSHPLNNKELGNAFEDWFCRQLFKHGWWVYNCPSNAHGQPADVIASHGRHMILCDCKVCTGNGFSFLRIEENQRNSMTLFEKRTDHGAMFAFLIPELDASLRDWKGMFKESCVWIIDWQCLQGLIEKDVHYLSNSKIREYGYPMEVLWQD